MSLPTNLAFLKRRLAQTVLSRGTPVTVRWQEPVGTADELGAFESVTPASGVLMALGVEEAARTVLRQYQEIEAGDLILDVLPDPEVTRAEGPPVALSALGDRGVQFQWNGGWYAQAALGEKLRQCWQLTAGGQRLMGTLLLRKAV